jgi:hypothetical protein
MYIGRWTGVGARDLSTEDYAMGIQLADSIIRIEEIRRPSRQLKSTYIINHS